MQRWHAEDPLAELFDDHSPYNYVLNNPISYFDVLGLGPSSGPPQSWDVNGDTQKGGGDGPEDQLPRFREPWEHRDYSQDFDRDYSGFYDQAWAEQLVGQEYQDCCPPGDDGVKVYIETDGIGHAYIELNGTIYSYGRYNGSYSPSMGRFGPVGDGVLLKKTGKEAQDFIEKRTKKFPTKVYTYKKINTEKAVNYLEKLYNNGNLNPNGEGKIVDTYYLLGNNCTTTVCNALRAGGINIDIIQTPMGFIDYNNKLMEGIPPSFNPGGPNIYSGW